MWPNKWLSCGLLASGAVLAIFGALLLTVLPAVIRDQVRKRGALGVDANGTLNEITTKWANPRYQINMEVWMFSVENVNDILYGDKPTVSQKGPYVFREIQQKKLNFSSNQQTVSYLNKKTFIFDQNMSCIGCKLSDRVTIPNILYQRVLAEAAGHKLLIPLLEVVLKELKESAFVEVSVGQALFEGYRDNLIDAICNHSLTRKFCKNFLKIPSRIGFFYGQNDTDDGEYLVHTGQVNIDDIGRIITWRNMSTLPAEWWSSNQSRGIIGSDGGLFPPGLSRADVLHIFVSQLCRSAYLIYKRDVQFRDIPAYRFGLSADVLDSTLPENKGYCNPAGHRYYSNVTQPTSCLPASLLDISRCQPGTPPVFISLSHFLYAPKEVQESIKGLPLPIESVDETFLDIEPTTSAVIRAMRRMQMNVGMWNGDGSFSAVKNMKNVVMPVLMVNETVVMDDATHDELLGRLVQLQRGVRTAGVVLLVLGALLWTVFVGLAVVICVRERRETSLEHESLLNDAEARPEDDVDGVARTVRSRP